MGSRLLKLWLRFSSRPFLPAHITALALICSTGPAWGQIQIKPLEEGGSVALINADMATLETDEPRKDLPCTVTPRKAELGFDLRFHGGYDVSLPLEELEGPESMLTVVFRVAPQNDRDRVTYFSQHIRVPAIEEDAKGDAFLQGAFDLGEGNYHVSWLMRDRSERTCSFSWDVQAELPAKDKQIALFLPASEVAQTQFEQFQEEPTITRTPTETPLVVKLLVNFSPQNKDSAALRPIDTSGIVTMLRTIDRDPRIGKFSLIAFNMQEQRVVYRQDATDHIDFPALGKALQSLNLGTVNVQRLAQKHGETQFLTDLINQEIGVVQPDIQSPDAVIFAGPKTLLDANVPQESLQRIGDIDCPMFYMNYNLNPQAVPWKDAISRAIRHFKGTEYTISRPRDLWYATSEMVSQIMKSRRIKESSALAMPTR